MKNNEDRHFFQSESAFVTEHKNFQKKKKKKHPLLTIMYSFVLFLGYFATKLPKKSLHVKTMHLPCTPIDSHTILCLSIAQKHL